MRSGVCGQRGSGGKAFNAAALAMPTRSAPSSLARRLTSSAFSSAICTSPLRQSAPDASPPFPNNFKPKVFTCEARGLRAFTRKVGSQAPPATPNDSFLVRHGLAVGIHARLDLLLRPARGIGQDLRFSPEPRRQRGAVRFGGRTACPGHGRMMHDIASLKIRAVAGLDEIEVFGERRGVVAHMQARHVRTVGGVSGWA